jgi:plasmid maintenance system antidote protein VapI
MMRQPFKQTQDMILKVERSKSSTPEISPNLQKKSVLNRVSDPEFLGNDCAFKRSHSARAAHLKHC